jgi:hypothetical protein
MRSHHRARETFQDETESPGSDIETTWLEPDAVRVRNPETVVAKVRIGDEVLAASLTWFKAVGKTVERGYRHVVFYLSNASAVNPS